MSRIPVLQKIAVTLAAGAVAAAGTVTAGTGPASAASSFRVRLAPWTNPFLFVEIQGSSTDTLAPVEQWHYTGGYNQVWRFVPIGDNYEIVNGTSAKCVMTDGVAGHRLFQAPCSGSPYQLWSIDSSWAGGDFSSTHGISNPASGLYMDVQGDSRTQGAYIDGYYRNYAPNQQFLAQSA
jgi:hypothetical protein